MRGGRFRGRPADQEGGPGRCEAELLRHVLDLARLDGGRLPPSAYGFTVYGAVDMGGGYDRGPKFNRDAPNGVERNDQQREQGRPPGLRSRTAWLQSNIGIKMKEQVAPNWFVVGDVNAGFDPYSLRFSNGPASLLDNDGVAQVNRRQRRLEPRL